jgi:hypothetical protein
MSTPSGKPSHPIELSAYLTRKAREREDAQPDTAQDGRETSRPPYAPKGTHQHNAPPDRGKNDHDAVVSAYAPKRAKEAAAGDPDATARAEHPASVAERQGVNVAERQGVNAAARQVIDEAPLCPDGMPGGPRAAAGPPVGRTASPDRARTAHERSSAKPLLDPDPAVSLQPAQSGHDRQLAQADGEARDTASEDRDLERLMASLRWLQLRQAAAMRLPRAPVLPPLRSRPALPNANVGAPSRERMVDAIRSPLLSLEPNRLTPPPIGHDHNPNTMLGIALACILMAGVVYCFLLAGRPPSSQATSKPQIASVAPRPAKSTMHTQGAAQLERRAPRAPDGELSAEADTSTQLIAAAPAASALQLAPQLIAAPPAASALEHEHQPSAAAPAASASQHESVALRPPATGADSSPPSKPVRTPDPEEISLLIKQGEKHIAAGDVVTARMIFQRAADSGDATAALALAATYDPTVLAKLGVIGMGADVEKARTWYRLAESLGSAEAKQRLQLLGRH